MGDPRLSFGDFRSAPVEVDGVLLYVGALAVGNDTIEITVFGHVSSGGEAALEAIFDAVWRSGPGSPGPIAVQGHSSSGFVDLHDHGDERFRLETSRKDETSARWQFVLPLSAGANGVRVVLGGGSDAAFHVDIPADAIEAVA